MYLKFPKGSKLRDFQVVSREMLWLHLEWLLPRCVVKLRWSGAKIEVDNMQCQKCFIQSFFVNYMVLIYALIKASLVINSQFSCVTNIKQEIDYFECAAVNILNLNWHALHSVQSFSPQEASVLGWRIMRSVAHVSFPRRHFSESHSLRKQIFEFFVLDRG